ncbi:MAG: hypothetical protein ABR555_10295 [Pyrinomonadaceae bacterium]
MPNVWTIHSNGLTGGNDKSDLVGCHVNVDGTGTHYQFTEPNINNVLSTTTGTSLPTPTFNFPSFSYQGHTWEISVTTLTGGASNNQAQGNWNNDDPEITGEQDGTWTAQAGSTAGDDIDEGGDEYEEDSASASA